MTFTLHLCPVSQPVMYVYGGHFNLLLFFNPHNSNPYENSIDSNYAVLEQLLFIFKNKAFFIVLFSSKNLNETLMF